MPHEPAPGAEAGTLFDRVRLTMLLIFALAWPWEIFQRIPGSTLTLSKVTGLILVLLAGAKVIRARSWTHLRTGLEIPLVLLALACVQSAFHSIDADASRSLLLIYFTYLVLFYAVTVLVSDSIEATLLARAFTVSCVAVAALALACAAGWASPVLAGATSHLGERITTEMRSGALMRIAATATDFNQAVLTFLLAFPLALFLARDGRSRLVSVLMACVLIAGIVVSFSRSSLLVVAAILLVVVATKTRKRLGASAAAVLCLAFGVGIVMVASPYFEALSQRALSGIGSRDSSYESRLYIFEVAVSLLPKYGWFGTGLGASDIVIHSAGDPARHGGMTLHSVPFKLFLETGIVGLVAYLWLWVHVFKTTWQRLAKSQNSESRRLGLALLGAFFGAFCVMAVQPFMALSLFPFLLALAFGPILSTSQSVNVTEASPKRSTEFAVAIVTVLIVIVPNLIAYQTVAARASRVADTLDRGPLYESKGDWAMAHDVYSAALELASGSEGPLRDARYYSVARKMVNLPYVYDAMQLGHTDPGLRAACLYGLGRAHHANGEFDEALEAFNGALSVRPDFAEAQFAAAETHWSAGRYTQALSAYAQAAHYEDLPENAGYRARMKAVDSRIESLGNSKDHDALLEAARLLRQRAKWADATQLCQRLSTEKNVPAQAYYYLGINEELRGKPLVASEMYRKALRRLPNHADAARRLRALAR